MMRGSIGGAGGGSSAADRERDYYRSEAYAREKEKEREREMERDFREHERDKERERERERERFARHRERERDRERDRRGEHQDRERERDQAIRGQQQHHQQQQQGPGQHINGHGPPPFHPNGHPQMPHNGPTTRNPLDMTHGGHPSSHLPPPPQASGPSGGGHGSRESRSHHHHHQVQNGPRTSSLGPNQAVIVTGPPGPVGGTAGLTAAQVHTAIVKGTEGPLQALAQANEQTWLLIGKFQAAARSKGSLAHTVLFPYNISRCRLRAIVRHHPSPRRLRKRPSTQPYECQRFDASSRHREE
jgi:hypothetical protein